MDSTPVIISPPPPPGKNLSAPFAPILNAQPATPLEYTLQAVPFKNVAQQALRSECVPGTDLERGNFPSARHAAGKPRCLGRQSLSYTPSVRE